MIRASSAFTHGRHYEGSRDILALLIGHPVGELRAANSDDMGFHTGELQDG